MAYSAWLIGGQEILTMLSLIAVVIAIVLVIWLINSTGNEPRENRTTEAGRKKINQATYAEYKVDCQTTGTAPEIDYQTAKVEHVIDGDTVIVSQSLEELRIRLDAIDCPENGQHWGDIAKYGLIKLIGGREIQFEEHCVDQYGRTVATIYVHQGKDTGWINVNARMVTLGHAWVMRNFNRHLPKERQDELNKLERWARSKKVGLWDSENPIPPWQWRGGDS